MTELQKEHLLTPNDAAQFLGGSNNPLSPTTLALWRSKGTGPSYIRVGKLIRYPLSGLNAFMQSVTVSLESKGVTSDAE